MTFREKDLLTGLANQSSGTTVRLDYFGPLLKAQQGRWEMVFQSLVVSKVTDVKMK